MASATSTTKLPQTLALSQSHVSIASPAGTSIASRGAIGPTALDLGEAADRLAWPGLEQLPEEQASTKSSSVNAQFEARSAPLPPFMIARLLSAALWRWRKQCACALTARWLRLHSSLYRFRGAVLCSRIRAQVHGQPRGPAQRNELGALARRLAGQAALRRWRQSAQAVYERRRAMEHSASLSRTNARPRTPQHVALSELVRVADDAARSREAEIRAETSHLAQALRQLHTRCLKRDAALRLAHAPAPMLVASSHAITAAAAAAATAVAAVTTGDAVSARRRQRSASPPQAAVSMPALQARMNL